jgi:hypothetical protein
MSRLTALLLISLTVLGNPTIVYSNEVSVAVLGGHHIFDKHSPTIYPGRDAYDDENGFGGYVRYRRGTPSLPTSPYLTRAWT